MIFKGISLCLALLYSVPVYLQFASLGEFSKHENEVLKGHVIKTIQANRMECTMSCADFYGCRSVNVYKHSNGTDVCELNDSSKSADVGSMVHRTGADHYELRERLTWREARKECRQKNGELLSVHSQQEQDFIATQLLSKAPKGNSSNTQLIMLWKLNGISDVSLRLHGTAGYKDVDGYKALYLDGNSSNYATTMPMKMAWSAFTVGAWIKLLKPASEGLIYGDWSNPFKFAVKIDVNGQVHFKIMFESTNTITLSLNRDSTLHIFINGNMEMKKVLSQHSRKIMQTNHRHDVGLDRNSSQVLHAYIRDLVVFNYRVYTSSIAWKRINRTDKLGAVWTGLNDLDNENTFKFSDGSPMSYTHWSSGYPQDMYKLSDCVGFSLQWAYRFEWMDASCGLELPYICRWKL